MSKGKEVKEAILSILREDFLDDVGTVSTMVSSVNDTLKDVAEREAFLSTVVNADDQLVTIGGALPDARTTELVLNLRLSPSIRVSSSGPPDSPLALEGDVSFEDIADALDNYRAVWVKS